MMKQNEDKNYYLDELRIRYDIGEISQEEYERLNREILTSEEPSIEIEPTIHEETQITKERPKSKITKILERVIITAIGIVGLYFLSPNFYVPPLWYVLIGPILILLASQLIPILVEWKGKNVVAYILKGVSLALFAYTLLITVGTRILPFFQLGYLGNLVVLIVFGFMIHGLGKELTVWERFIRFESMFSGAGVITVGLALWKMTETVNIVIIWPITMVDVGWVFLTGSLSVAAAFFSVYSHYLKEPIIIGISNWLKESQLRTFLSLPLLCLQL